MPLSRGEEEEGQKGEREIVLRRVRWPGRSPGKQNRGKTGGWNADGGISNPEVPCCANDTRAHVRHPCSPGANASRSRWRRVGQGFPWFESNHRGMLAGKFAFCGQSERRFEVDARTLATAPHPGPLPSRGEGEEGRKRGRETDSPSHAIPRRFSPSPLGEGVPRRSRHTP